MVLRGTVSSPPSIKRIGFAAGMADTEAIPDPFPTNVFLSSHFDREHRDVIAETLAASPVVDGLHDPCNAVLE